MANSEPTTALFRRILITGAAGFVGRRLVAALASTWKADLFTADRSSTPIVGATPLAMDLMQSDKVQDAVREARPDLVIHLAAQSSVGHGGGAAAATWKTNLGGSLSLAEAITRHAPAATVLFISSAEVYGRAFNDGVASEETVPDPQSAYAGSKLAAEHMFRDVLPADTRLIVARPSNHSGAGQDQRFVLPSFAAQIAAGSAAIKVGNLTAQRDFTHIDNVVDAYMALLEHAGNLTSRTTVNIGSGVSRSVGELLDQMIALSGGRAAVEVDPARLRPVDVPVARIDISRLEALTGWKPARSIEIMLTELLTDQVSVKRIATML